jgi:L-seryl-tRNA(Ser) seleniumtransferase
VVGRSLQEGADVVTMSGDKLLGGPQAGLVVGRRDLVDAMRKNPLYRALRVDKMTLAALDVVLAEHEAGRAESSVPVLRMLAADAEAIRPRAEALAAALRGRAPRLAVEVVEGSSAVGGGAAPTVDVPTVLVAVTHPSLSPDRLASLLRAGAPPIVARVADDRLVLDLRTVLPEEEPSITDALARAASLDE